jgi:membrane protein implicated in regulation of membrane protease activity
MENWLRNISLKTWAIILFVLGIFLLFIPFLLTRVTFCNIDFTATGQIGDTISGTTAPFIGFIGIILTFVAFWVQYRANIDQRQDLHRERVENKFYEMVRLHRDNVAEISIGANSPVGCVEGRKAFISMFEEFKYGYHLLEIQYRSSHELKLFELGLAPGDLVNIAYVFFFFGVGTLSTPLATKMLKITLKC